MEQIGQGKLRIEAFTASEALPVEKTHIRVSGADENNSSIQFSSFTDANGISADILLPAPWSGYSLTPQGQQIPYSTYDVVISKDGFYTKTICGVPIFDGTLAVLPIEMLPLAYDENGDVQKQKNINSDIYENENLI